MATCIPGSRYICYICFIVAGISCGADVNLTLATASELLGLKNFGLVCNLLYLVNSHCTMVLGQLFRMLLATTDVSFDNELQDCRPYLFMAVICTLGFILVVMLASRMKNLYLKIYGARFEKRRIGGGLLVAKSFWASHIAFVVGKCELCYEYG